MLQIVQATFLPSIIVVNVLQGSVGMQPFNLGLLHASCKFVQYTSAENYENRLTLAANHLNFIGRQ